MGAEGKNLGPSNVNQSPSQSSSSSASEDSDHDKTIQPEVKSIATNGVNKCGPSRDRKRKCDTRNAEERKRIRKSNSDKYNDNLDRLYRRMNYLHRDMSKMRDHMNQVLDWHRITAEGVAAVYNVISRVYRQDTDFTKLTSFEKYVHWFENMPPASHTTPIAAPSTSQHAAQSSSYTNGYNYWC